MIKDINGIEWTPYDNYREYERLKDVVGEDWYIAKSKGAGQCSLDSLSIAMHWDRHNKQLEQLRMQVASDPFLQSLMERSEESIANTHCFLNPESIFYLASPYDTIPLIVNGAYDPKKSDLGGLECTYLQYHPISPLQKATKNFIVIDWVGKSHYQPMAKYLGRDEKNRGVFQTQFSWQELSPELQYHFNICLDYMQKLQDNKCSRENIEPCYLCKVPFDPKHGAVQCQAICVNPNTREAKQCQRPADNNYLTKNPSGGFDSKYCWYHFQKEHVAEYQLQQEAKQLYEQMAKEDVASRKQKAKEDTASRKQKMKAKIQIEEETKQNEPYTPLVIHPYEPELLYHIQTCSVKHGMQNYHNQTQSQLEAILAQFPSHNQQLVRKTWYAWDTFDFTNNAHLFIDFLCRVGHVDTIDIDHPISILDANDCEAYMYEQSLNRLPDFDFINTLLQKHCKKGKGKQDVIMKFYYNPKALKNKWILYERRFLNCLGPALLKHEQEILDYLQFDQESDRLLYLFAGVPLADPKWNQIYTTYLECATGLIVD